MIDRAKRVAVAIVLATTSASAEEEPLVPPEPPASRGSHDEGPPIDYDTPRIEPAGFPLIAGNSDIGVQFGGVATLTRFNHGQRPYVWNLDVLVALSVKGGPHGAEIVQQNYYGQIDATDLFGGKVRSLSAAYYQKTVDTGYFGRGNASPSAPPQIVDGDKARFFKYDAREVRLRSFNRVHMKYPFDLMVAPILRFHDPQIYPGSKLDIDAHTRDAKGHALVHGLGKTSIGSLGVGLVIDSRDNEFFPRRGMYHQMGTRYVQGLAFDGDVQCGGTGFIFANYFPLPGPFVFATRVVLDFLYGNVPFYDLYNAGPFNVWEMPGGREGVRGVPLGRYSGPIKAVGNAEVRAMFTRFHLFGQMFKLGGDVFADTGRLWDDYTFRSPRDGTGIGLKWGTGAGAYLQWGEAAVFRLEMAYSPEARAETPNFPFGVYVADSVMF